MSTPAVTIRVCHSKSGNYYLLHASIELTGASAPSAFAGACSCGVVVTPSAYYFSVKTQHHYMSGSSVRKPRSGNKYRYQVTAMYLVTGTRIYY